MPPDPDCNLRVGGLTALSATDYPGCLSAVVFCQGCPWRCAYCHNPHLLPRHGEHRLAWLDVMAFLERRRGLLDAVVFSGGEPTLQAALPNAMRAVRNMGFKIGLHTAGIYPARLRRLLPLVDWVGLDIKAPFNDYPKTTGVRGSGERALQSLKMVIASGVAHEFRTTVSAGLLAHFESPEFARTLADLGVRNYVLQECRGMHAASPGIPGDVSRKLSRMFSTFCLRHA